MVSAAIIGTALGGGAAGPDWSLFVDGSDIRGRVPLDTIEVTENGPGAVSSMHFVVDDPTAVFSIQNGASVLYFNHNTDLPVFRGWVQVHTARVMGVGRQFEVTCDGAEILLDWLIIPSLTIPAGTYDSANGGTSGLVQRLYAATTGIGVALNVNADPDHANGTQALPVGGRTGFNSMTLADDLVLNGTTFREAIRQLIHNDPSAQFPFVHKETVDFWLGLRFINIVEVGNPGNPSSPEDYADLTLTATPAGPAPGGQDHELDSAGVVRGVYVKGGNAAGTGLLMDGSGLPGPVAFIEKDTILTDAGWRAVAFAYLLDNTEAARGSVRKETFTVTDTPAAHVQVMSNVTITDAQLGLSAQTYEIMSITKRFHGGNLETWTIGYGGLPPSLPRAIRRLTRDTRS